VTDAVIRVRRQHGLSLGRRDGGGAADALEPFRRRHVSGLVARQQAGRIRVIGRDGPGL
jgi:hypothetical protein